MKQLLDMKERMAQVITEDSAKLFELSHYIHENPEMAYKEVKAAKALCAFLEDRGFEVTRGAGGLETAFTSRVCPSGVTHPVIAILAEYDALTIGHACGHNVIATTAMGAAAAVKKVMEQEKLPGTLYVVGCPAEETGGGKIALQEAGIFDDVDAMILLHPTSGTTKIAGNCRSYYKLRAYFHGKGAHAGSHPEDGINAADAAALTYTAIGYLRNQMPEGVQITPLILEAGAENGLIPDSSEMSIRMQAFKLSTLETMVEKVRNCIKAGALGTGCTVDIKDEPGYKGRVCSYVLARAVRENLALLGEPTMEGMVDDRGGEDFGNLNRVIPGVMVYPTLLPEQKISNHTDRFRELADSPKSREVILLGSKVMAYSVLDWLMNPGVLDEAKAELEELKKTF